MEVPGGKALNAQLIPEGIRQQIHLAFGSGPFREWPRASERFLADPFAELVSGWEQVLGQASRHTVGDEYFCYIYRWHGLTVYLSVSGPYAIVRREDDDELLTAPSEDPLERYIFSQLHNEAFQVLPREVLALEVPMHAEDCAMYNDGEPYNVFNYFFVEYVDAP